MPGKSDNGHCKKKVIHMMKPFYIQKSHDHADSRISTVFDRNEFKMTYTLK